MDTYESMETLCQACVNVQQQCVCSEYNQEYCNDCGGNCDGVHSLTGMKTLEMQAEELSKLVLSYGKEISKLVANYLEVALNK